jgi:hypothetical protein
MASFSLSDFSTSLSVSRERNIILLNLKKIPIYKQSEIIIGVRLDCFADIIEPKKYSSSSS